MVGQAFLPVQTWADRNICPTISCQGRQWKRQPEFLDRALARGKRSVAPGGCPDPSFFSFAPKGHAELPYEWRRRAFRTPLQGLALPWTGVPGVAAARGGLTPGYYSSALQAEGNGQNRETPANIMRDYRNL